MTRHAAALLRHTSVGSIAVLLALIAPANSNASLTYTYTYGGATIVGTDGGTGETLANRVALNDGFISPDFPNVGAMPCCAWDPAGGGGGGVLYNNPGLANPQPLINIDLGSSSNLDRLDVYYFVRTQSGVNAPVTLDVMVGADSVPQFSGFNNTPIPATEGSQTRLASIDLTGFSGSTLSLDFTGIGGATFVGLTEIEVFTAPVTPEPSAFMLAGLAIGGFAVRRRRRS